MVSNLQEAGSSMRSKTKLQVSWFTKENQSKAQLIRVFVRSKQTSKTGLKNYSYEEA